MFDIFSNGGLFALFQVILIDIALAGDNALVIGMSAARVPLGDRRKVIFWGLVAAVVLRLIMALTVVSLLDFVPALLPIGGVILLWVCWRMWRDIQHAHTDRQAAKAIRGCAPSGDPRLEHLSGTKAVRRAILTIAVADVSMSLDNVLAVSGAALHHVPVLVIGLIFSIALMGLAASLVAKLLHRFPWISYAGLFIVLYVAVMMIIPGIEPLKEAVQAWL